MHESQASGQEKIAWVHGREPYCDLVGQLLSSLDKLIWEVGLRLAECNIKDRTPVRMLTMVTIRNI